MRALWLAPASVCPEMYQTNVYFYTLSIVLWFASRSKYVWVAGLSYSLQVCQLWCLLQRKNWSVRTTKSYIFTNLFMQIFYIPTSEGSKVSPLQLLSRDDSLSLSFCFQYSLQLQERQAKRAWNDFCHSHKILKKSIKAQAKK